MGKRNFDFIDTIMDYSEDIGWGIAGFDQIEQLAYVSKNHGDDVISDMLLNWRAKMAQHIHEEFNAEPFDV